MGWAIRRAWVAAQAGFARETSVILVRIQQVAEIAHEVQARTVINRGTGIARATHSKIILRRRIICPSGVRRLLPMR
jgi:hypothetical protein